MLGFGTSIFNSITYCFGFGPTGEMLPAASPTLFVSASGFDPIFCFDPGGWRGFTVGRGMGRVGGMAVRDRPEQKISFDFERIFYLKKKCLFVHSSNNVIPFWG